MLGWTMNTQGLLFILPTNKFDAWLEDMVAMSTNGKTTFGDLETTVGCLNHAAYVIPLAQHFLSRLRSRLMHRKPKAQENHTLMERTQGPCLVAPISHISLPKTINEPPDHPATNLSSLLGHLSFWI
jgi:hypothetical protein